MQERGCSGRLGAGHGPFQCEVGTVDPEAHALLNLVVQAGVALGLAKTLAIRFPTWGPDFASILVRPSPV